MASVDINDVMRPHQPILDNFNNHQHLEWSRWENDLPKRVAYVTNGHMASGRKRSMWRNISYLFLILSAIVPVIVTILANVYAVPTLVDAVFPVLTTIVQIKLDHWVKALQGFSEVYSNHQRLLADIIFDIATGNYSANRNNHENTWTDLENQMREHDILELGYSHWYD